MTNYELDVAIEDPALAETMAAQYERDLAYATEIVLTRSNRVRETEPRPAPESDAAGAAARWPIALLAGWLGMAWAWKGWKLLRRRGSAEPVREPERAAAPPSGEPRG